jgi:pyridoxine 5-phosphate synthase
MRLFINVDHVATLRQARRTDEPDPVRAAVLAELGGADGITVHLREDRRHIQDRDVDLLLRTVREGGLDVGPGNRERVAGALARLHSRGIRTSLFIDPDPETVQASIELGPVAVELHTGEYANARTVEERASQVARLLEAVEQVKQGGLAAHAGHGLTYENVMPVAAIGGCEELNIGHSVISRAVLVGIERAVREMKELVLRARTG